MRFSIVTVNYNNGSELEETILSVVNQTFRDFEYIVIDGGSNDNSVEILKNYSDNISYWVSERDSGIYNAMNKGIRVASGEYCLFMNAGDTFYSEDILGIVNSFLDADIVCGNAQIVKGGNYVWVGPEKLDLSWWLNRYSICHQSTFIKTDILKSRPYDEKYKVVADYESFFYETIVNRRTYKHIEIIICNYGVDGISSTYSKVDDDKLRVIDSFRYQGLLEDDELLHLCKKLHYGGRRYQLALKLLKFLSNE